MDSNIIEGLKQLKEQQDKVKALKKLHDENTKEIEKIRKTNLQAKKIIINNIVNLEIIEKLLNENTVFNDGYNLIWVDDSGNKMTIKESIDIYRKILKE